MSRKGLSRSTANCPEAAQKTGAKDDKHKANPCALQYFHADLLFVDENAGVLAFSWWFWSMAPSQSACFHSFLFSVRGEEDSTEHQEITVF